MKTGCFFTYDGPGRVSIATMKPWWMEGIGEVPVYKALAPRRDMLKMDYDPYRVLYHRILEELTPATVWDELHDLVHPHDPVLLCWEKTPLLGPPEGRWCHRRMVAEWFESHLNFQVLEVPVK